MNQALFFAKINRIVCHGIVCWFQDYNVEVNLRLYWLDERLAHDKLTKEKLNIPDGYDYAVLNPKLIEKLWTPDIYIGRIFQGSCRKHPNDDN